MHDNALSLKNIFLCFEDAKSIFDGLSCTFNKGRSGLVGRNGTGKSTLLRIASGDLTPSRGRVARNGKLTYCRQLNGVLSSEPICDWLGVTEILEALARIDGGELRTGDIETVDGKWSFQSELLSAMTGYALSHLSLQTPVNQLSGGELTRLQLAFAFASKPDILLLDEPSNNLDSPARTQLYRDINAFKGTLVVASHDRELLEHMDRIYELSSLGLFEYGGAYSFYEEQKRLRMEAAEAELHARIGQLSNAKGQIQKRREIHQQGEAKGRRIKKAMIVAKGRCDRTALNAAKGRSEKTNKKIRTQAKRKLDQINVQLTEARSRVEEKYEFNISLPSTKVHATKRVVDIDKMSFSYDKSRVLIDNFSLAVYGPERIAIDGPNGCGKSTLLALLRRKISPNKGICEINVEKVAYLDQKASGLNPELTVLQNFRNHNVSMSTAQVFQNLAFFLFRKEALQQKVDTLSGGERVRLLLACILMAEAAPQLLILDEPTNHLDIDSVECIEKALNRFEGAMLVVSHDSSFLSGIGVTRRVSLGRRSIV